MSPLRPVKSTYTPRYPRRLTEAELRDYLRPGLARRFSSETMILSSLLVGSTLVSCAKPDVPDGTKPLPMMGKSTRTDPELKAKVNQIVVELLANQQKGGWYEGSEVRHYRLIADNALIKYPDVKISFGNSISGIFDVEAAREATRELFEAYGITLERDVRIKGDGYDFIADGYDRELNVGFEIRDGRRDGWGWDARRAEERSGRSFLGQQELIALEKDVNDDKTQVFAINPYKLYDGDERMAMSFYLASVIDYLNWIHGDRTIEYERVLADSKGLAKEWVWDDMILRPLWTVDSDQRETAVTAWNMDHGGGEPDSTGEEEAVLLKMEPGATALYQPSAPIPFSIAADPPWAELRLTVSCTAPNGKPADIAICMNEDPELYLRHTFLPGDDGIIDFRPHYEVVDTISALKSLSIRNVNRFPISLRLVRIDKSYHSTMGTRLPPVGDTE